MPKKTPKEGTTQNPESKTEKKEDPKKEESFKAKKGIFKVTNL